MAEMGFVKFAKAVLDLILQLLVVPALVPLGVMYFKSCFDLKDIRGFRSMIPKVPDVEKRKREFMSGEKGPVLCRNCVTMVLMAFAFTIVTGSRLLLLNRYPEGLVCMSMALAIGAIYAIIRWCLLKAEFRCYAFGAENPLRFAFFMLAALSWLPATAIFLQTGKGSLWH